MLVSIEVSNSAHYVCIHVRISVVGLTPFQHAYRMFCTFLYTAADPNAVCCRCLKRSLPLSFPFQKLEKQLFSVLFAHFSVFLPNPQRFLGILQSGESSLNSERSKAKRSAGEKLGLESSLRSWTPPWDVCGGLAFLQQFFGSPQAIAALCHGASLLSRQRTRGEQRCHRDRPARSLWGWGRQHPTPCPSTAEHWGWLSEKPWRSPAP